MSGELVAINTIDEILNQQKDEMHKSIRGHRNELMSVMEHFGKGLPVMESLKIQQFMIMLNTIDYMIDKQFGE